MAMTMTIATSTLSTNMLREVIGSVDWRAAGIAGIAGLAIVSGISVLNRLVKTGNKSKRQKRTVWTTIFDPNSVNQVSNDTCSKYAGNDDSDYDTREDDPDYID